MKTTLLLFICLSLFTTVNLAQSKKSKNKKIKPKKKEVEFICKLPSSVEWIHLNKNEITKCSVNNSSCSEKMMQIEVRTVARAADTDKYVYTVSGGKIIGDGANVIWNLSDVKPGTYTITSGISQPIFDGEKWEVLGKTQTQIITVKECPDCK